MNISRRNFLFGSAAAIAVAATPAGVVAELVQPMDAILPPITENFISFVHPNMWKALLEASAQFGPLDIDLSAVKTDDRVPMGQIQRFHGVDFIERAA